ncbi:MAG: hypothetical protein QXG00_05130 [Candidatus Woesearchaeota archaeon]
MTEYKGIIGYFNNIYKNYYKQLMILSFILLFVCIGIVGYKLITTGDFVEKGVSLKGGITVTIPIKSGLTSTELEAYLKENVKNADISVRTLSEAGLQKGLLIEASDIDSATLISLLNKKIPNLGNNYSIEQTGSSLGHSFFSQTLKAIYIAFIFMATVVFFYFGENTKSKIIATVLGLTSVIIMFNSHNLIMTILSLIITLVLIYVYIKYSIPSFAIMLCAFSDIFFAIAVINILGIKLSTGGVAALLMLVGYSVDSDILMSVRVLKKKEGTVLDRIYNSIKTGLTMNIAAQITAVVTIILSQSEVIKQIMIILWIGLIGDIIFTWIQNAGILRMYMEKKHHQK